MPKARFSAKPYSPYRPPDFWLPAVVDRDAGAAGPPVKLRVVALAGGPSGRPLAIVEFQLTPGRLVN